MTSRTRFTILAVVVAVLFAPVVADHDSFPLSTYPMYSSTRSDVVSFVTAEGLDAIGRRHVLSLGVIGASDDPLIVAGELRSALAAGRAEHRCREIAERAGSSADGAQIVAIEVVSERHDVVAHVSGESSLVERIVHARCETEQPS